ncbi:protein-L-isoaspartate O-methyltransferase [Paeniroseomonas aquatica]|uniref:Protein-L-isoaspartate O-methyltransferase n=1 Tax=Paeniroseomonas aquatica TaxID=373043 RepID=A0ABT8A088_9PROT|nr:methyltransferase [Paeniroseomonas aquatica]MDN3563135.1 methyltransferase [Paeniroseomonas aquatica]
MNERAAKLRIFYARFVSQHGEARDPRVEAAFASVPRETFVGPAPWFVYAGPGPTYVQAPDDDPAFLYADVLIALEPSRGVNNGQPSLHARCLDALGLRPGETVLHVGAGAGYYTALLAHLVAPGGIVHAYEVDPDLAARAKANLSGIEGVSVHTRSGIGEGLPAADAVYVNAGLGAPSWTWLDALRPGGRLLFPLQPEQGFGGMLLITKPAAGGIDWPARFVSRASFIPCDAPIATADEALVTAFAGGGWQHVRSFHLNDRHDSETWYCGDGWSLSLAAPAEG